MVCVNVLKKKKKCYVLYIPLMLIFIVLTCYDVEVSIIAHFTEVLSLNPRMCAYHDQAFRHKGEINTLAMCHSKKNSRMCPINCQSGIVPAPMLQMEWKHRYNKLIKYSLQTEGLNSMYSIQYYPIFKTDDFKKQ